MTTLDIKIQSLAEAKKTALFADITPETTTHISNISVAILEAGMASGLTSVMFKFTTPDGHHYIAQTSAKIVNTLNGAVIGAQQRFGDHLKQ